MVQQAKSLPMVFVLKCSPMVVSVQTPLRPQSRAGRFSSSCSLMQLRRISEGSWTLREHRQPYCSLSIQCSHLGLYAFTLRSEKLAGVIARMDSINFGISLIQNNERYQVEGGMFEAAALNS